MLESRGINFDQQNVTKPPEHVPTRETPDKSTVIPQLNKESQCLARNSVITCKKKKKKRNALLDRSGPTVPSGNFSSPSIFRESREQSRSHTSPIPPSLPLTQPSKQSPPSSSNLGRRASPPLRPRLRVEAGRLRAETARGVGVVPGASHQRRRPTDRPTDRPSRPSRLLSARPVSSREPSRGLFHLRNRRSCYALPCIPTHRTQRGHHDQRRTSLLSRARVPPSWQAALCTGELWRLDSTRKMGRTPSHEPRIDREINVRWMDVE